MSTISRRAWWRLALGACLLAAAACSDESLAPVTSYSLAFTRQPTTGSVGIPLPAVVVTVRDARGSVATRFTGDISLALATNSLGATLTGTTTVAAVAGVATFSNLSVSADGTGYTLTASATGMSAVTSRAFSIGRAVLAQLPVLLSTTYPTPPGIFGSASRAAAAVSTVAYASLAPGTVPHGASATIVNTNPSAGAAPLIAALTNGGLDPVAVPAVQGDTLVLALLDSSSQSTQTRIVVPGRINPRVVRTYPPKGKTGVPINAQIVVVFTEPMVTSTVDSTTVTLSSGPTPVHGVVSPSADGLSVTFTPDAFLQPNQAYDLTLGTGITSQAGLGLEASVQSAFTTGASTATLSALVVYGGLKQTVDSGGVAQLHAVGLDQGGNVVPNPAVTYALRHPATDFTTSVTPAGLVTGLAIGTDTIVATGGGLSTPFVITVVSAEGAANFTGVWDLTERFTVGPTCVAGSLDIFWLGTSFGPEVQGTAGPCGDAPQISFSTLAGNYIAGDTINFYFEFGAGNQPAECGWTGTYVSTPDPHIVGTVVNFPDWVSGTTAPWICGIRGASGTWEATLPTPVVSLTAPPQVACTAGGFDAVPLVTMKDANGNPVGRYPLQAVTSDNPSVAVYDSTYIADNGEIGVSGLVPILCKAPGQTQIHITQDLATATITVTVTP